MMGFQNHLQSESIPGTLPPTQNSPQHCPHNLYAEQLSGTAFTVPRTHNLRTWLYRRHPSVSHQPYRLVGWFGGTTADDYKGEEGHTPEQMRWSPFQIVEGDFVNGVKTVGLAGSPTVKHGLAIHVYSMTMGMSDRQKAFQCSDGDWLIVPQQGAIQVMTEFGKLVVEPGEIIVIPCGIKMAIDPLDTNTDCRGYILETQSHNHFELPDLGPIGANGLANPHHFCHPTASELDGDGEWVVVNKYAGKQFECKMSHTPFNVVAWRGNYLPYKYDLRLFNAIGTVTFDHPDPSIFTVLTVKTPSTGTALADFVIFPPRWAVADHTFRPPYYHRNTMCEFMGLIYGDYEAKPVGTSTASTGPGNIKNSGFRPGGASLHPVMSAHGPDRHCYEKAVQATLQPERVADNTLAFMFETSLMVRPTRWALTISELQADYVESAWLN